MALQLRSVTYLCADRVVQNQAAGLLSALGLARVWDQHTLPGDVAVTSGLASSNGLVVELLSLPSAHRYRLNRNVNRGLQVLSVNLGTPGPQGDLPGVAVPLLPNFRNTQPGLMGFMTSLWSRISASTGVGLLPCVHEIPSQTPCTPSVPQSGVAHSNAAAQPAVHEVVLGLPPHAQADAEDSLGAAGYTRLPSALSVWRSQAQGATALRILPAQEAMPFSAIVLRSDAPQATLEAAHAWGKQEPHSPLACTCQYGLKAGVPEAAQGQVTCDALPGLDIRVTGRQEHAPFFNESQEVYSEDVDASLNPGHGDVPPLACRSIVGMEMAASAKRNLRFLKQL